MRFINKNKSLGLLNDAKKEAEKIIESANEKGENIKKNKIIQAKEKFLELKSEHEKIIYIYMENSPTNRCFENP